ncbi:hypothetical protein N9J49_05070 [Amylibacter sp.]|nr:hypothetical protein [Amylibacter sp.]
MARRVVGNPFENQLPTVAATARPVDTYVRGVVEKNPLEGLAKLLSNLEKKAVPALQREEERRANAEYAEGVQLYNKNRIEMGQAVKDGLIEEGASPYLRKGYRVSHLNAMGARYTNELSNALDNQELYKNGNPDSIAEFTDKFYTDFQENNGLDGYRNVEVAEYFSGAASKANEAFRQSWTEKNVTWQKEQNYAAWTNEISTYADAMFLEDDTDTTRAIKTVKMADWLNSKAKLAEIDGMDREKVNKTIIDAIVLSAYELKDPDVLDVLDSVVTGTGKLGGSIAAREAVFDARGNISTIIANEELATSKAIIAKQKKFVANAETNISSLIIESTASDITPEKLIEINGQIDGVMIELMKSGQAGNSDASSLYRTLIKFRQAQAKVGAENRGDSDNAFAAVMSQLASESSITDVYQTLTTAIVDDVIAPKDANTLLGQWKTVYGTGQSLDWLTPNSPSKAVKGQLLSAIGGLNTFDLSGDLIVLNAGNAFDKNYMQAKVIWKQANPDAMFTDAVQYQIAQQAMVLTQKSFVSLDDQGAALITQQTIKEEYEEVEAELLADAEAEAARQAIIEASRNASGSTTTLTADQMLEQIEGGVN